MDLIYSKEETPLGTGGALKLAQVKLRKDHVLVMNGDSLVDFDYHSFFSWHINGGNDVTLLLSWMEDPSRYGAIEIDKNSKVVSFVEKSTKTIQGFINAGIYLMRTESFRQFPQVARFSLEKDFFPSMVDHGLYGFRNTNRVRDIGTPEAYKNFLVQHEN